MFKLCYFFSNIWLYLNLWLVKKTNRLLASSLRPPKCFLLHIKKPILKINAVRIFSQNLFWSRIILYFVTHDKPTEIGTIKLKFPGVCKYKRFTLNLLYKHTKKTVQYIFYEYMYKHGTLIVYSMYRGLLNLL